MRRLSLALAAALAAGQAAALSCPAPEIARDHGNAVRSGKTFLVVDGWLWFDDARLPDPENPGETGMPPFTDIAATLSGRKLTGGTTSEPYSQRIELRVLCVGPWCAQPMNGQRVLAYLEDLGDRHRLLIGPCPAMAHTDPAPELIDGAQACLSALGCAAAD